MVLALGALWPVSAPALAADDAVRGGAAVRGVVELPVEISIADASPDARLIIQLKDHTPVAGRPIMHWEAPALRTQSRPVRGLLDRKPGFAFLDVPQGMYSVAVLIDYSRPFIPLSARAFPAYPGDFVARSEVIEVAAGTAHDVVLQGNYLPVPEQFSAPYFLDE